MELVHMICLFTMSHANMSQSTIPNHNLANKETSDWPKGLQVFGQTNVLKAPVEPALGFNYIRDKSCCSHMNAYGYNLTMNRDNAILETVSTDKRQSKECVSRFLKKIVFDWDGKIMNPNKIFIK